MKILLTGVAGFIGSNIAERLVKNGDTVIGIDNLLTGKHDNIKHLEIEDNFSFIIGDLRDYDICNLVTGDVDAVCHQAALPSVPRSVDNPIASNAHNVTATLNLLHACVKNKVKRVVYASSSSVYGDTPTLPKKEDMRPQPKSPYAVSKLTGEYYMTAFNRSYGLDTVSLRYFNVFGARQNPKSQYAAVIPKFMISAIKGEDMMIYGDGTQSRDFTYIDNVVNANVMALNNKVPLNGEFMNIACGERHTLTDLCKEIKNIVGGDSKIVYSGERRGDVKHSLADITRAKNILGYEPKVGFIDGLNETFEFYKRWLDGERTEV